MTSSPHSFAYSYRLVKKCFLKICETSKCHNFLIFQPNFIRFSLLCLKFVTPSSEIKLNLLWSSSGSNFRLICRLASNKGQPPSPSIEPRGTYARSTPSLDPPPPPPISREKDIPSISGIGYHWQLQETPPFPGFLGKSS